MCYWFVGNKLSIKSTLFTTKNKKKKIGTLNVKSGEIKIKQYSKITYLGCELDENLPRENITLKAINNTNGLDSSTGKTNSCHYI